jgi:hypothetical protein
MGRKKITNASTADDTKAVAVVPGDLPTLGGFVPDIAVLGSAEGARQIVAWLNRKYAETELSAFQIGTVLNKAALDDLHKHLGFASFDSFCRDELHIPRTTAYRFMAIASALTEEEFRDLGPSRAGLVARLPYGARRALLPEAKTLTVRALAERVSEIADGPKPMKVQKANPGEAVTIGLRATSTEIPMTKLGEGAAVGVLPCLGGRAIALQFALTRTDDGRMQMLVTPLVGDE